MGDKVVGWWGKIKANKKDSTGEGVESLMFGNHQANANFQGKGVVKKMKLFTFKSESLGKDWYDLKIVVIRFVNKNIQNWI